MDPRTRWQTLQSHLTEAKARLDSGAPDEALRLVETALNLDPEFLAARDLRDSILHAIAAEFQPEATFAAAAARPPAIRAAAAPSVTSEPSVAPSANELWLRPAAQLADAVDLQAVPPAALAPGTPAVGPAVTPAFVPAAPPAFEAKARLRRSERCLEVARQMAARGRLVEARRALAEARSLAPASEGVARLAAELSGIDPQGQARRRWRPLAAALAFVIALSGGWWLNRDAALHRLAMEAMDDARGLMTPGSDPLDPSAPVPGVTGVLPGASASPPGTPAEPPAAAAGVGDSLPPAQEEVTVLSTTGTFGAPLTTRTITVPAPVPATLDRRAARITPTDATPGTAGTSGTPAVATTTATAATATAATAAPAPAPALPDAAPVAPAPQPPVARDVPITAGSAASATVAAPSLPPAPASGGVDAAPRTLTGGSPATTAAVTPSAGVPTAAGIPAAAGVPTLPGAPSDDRLVRDTLQRYRAAYDALDASSARAVWPSVNSAALARAFADLSAQQLRFDDCAVQVAGSAAQATCRGSARYVPRVGSREPREEARTWQFALRKSGTQWLIESTRVSAR